MVPGHQAWQTTSVAANPGNNKPSSPHLVPGARGQPLGAQCPMKKNQEATQGSILQTQETVPGPGTAYLHSSKSCYSSRTCSFYSGLASWAPPHFLTLSPLNIVQPPGFPAGLHTSLFQEVYQDYPASALLAHISTPVYLLHTY